MVCKGSWNLTDHPELCEYLVDHRRFRLAADKLMATKYMVPVDVLKDVCEYDYKFIARSDGLGWQCVRHICLRV